MSKQSQELKDGQVEVRAMRAIGATEVYTAKSVHVRVGGSERCLCGFAGQGLSEWSVDNKKLVRCQRCANRAATLIEAQKKKEVRNYWLNPQHGGVKRPATAASKQTRTQWEPLPLDPELLPTGSGKGKGIELMWRAEETRKD